MPIALILGANGQDGSYLANFLLDKEYLVYGTSRSIQSGAEKNVTTIKASAKIPMLELNLENFDSISRLIDQVLPDEIYNLSGLSSVSASFSHPLEAMASIATSASNLLEALRLKKSHARLFNAASTECFGETQSNAPADETSPLRPRSPYGVAKAAVLMQTTNYREAYGLFTCSGILGNHESSRRPKNFVISKIVNAAVAISQGSTQRLALGNTRIIRDWGWAPEYVEAMWRMLQQDKPRDYVIATGESCSLAAVVEMIFNAAGLDWRDHVDADTTLLRPMDIEATYVNPRLAREKMGWVAHTRVGALVKKLVIQQQALLEL